MYPATAIFRTSDGLIPAYTLAPMGEMGKHKLMDTLFVMDGDAMHAVSEVEVYPSCGFNILSTPLGWYAIADGADPTVPGLQYVGRAQTSFGGAVSRMAPRDLMEKAMLAAVDMTGLSLMKINGMIGRLAFLDFRTSGYTQREYQSRGKFTLRGTRMTDIELACFVYMTLSTLFRCGRMRKSARVDGSTVISVEHGIWRDYLIAAMAYVGLRPSVSYYSQLTRIRVEQATLRELFAHVNGKYKDSQYLDFKFCGATAGYHTEAVVVNGEYGLDKTTILDQRYLYLTRYTTRTAMCPGIKLCGVDTKVEFNSLRVGTSE